MRAVTPFLPTEADVHLLTAIQPLPDDMRDDAFAHGLTFTIGMECALPQGWPMCQTDADAEKCGDVLGDDVGFKSFLGYYAIEPCATGMMHAATEQDKAIAARLIFDAVKHQVIARQLWWGAYEPTSINANGVLMNPNLRSVATVLGGTPTTADPISIIARLVAARQKLSGSGLVLIHGPQVLIPFLVSAGTMKRVGGRYEGPGFIYVVDAAYPDDVAPFADMTGGPIQTGSIEDDDAVYYADTVGTAWLYATGAIQFAWGRYITKSGLGAPRDNDGRYSEYTTWDARQNRTLIVVEEEAFLRFDPCGILAARAYIPTTTQGEGP